jgi:hypothetical protein
VGVEVDRPARPARRNGAKSDELDAARAAREALAREHLTQPRQRGECEAICVLLVTREGAVVARTKAIGQLKALIINAPEGLRHQLRGFSPDEQLIRCARLRTRPTQSTEHRSTIIALRSSARRALTLEAEAHDLETELQLLVRELAPALLAEPGVGVICAAQLLTACSHPGRFRSEAPSPRSPARPQSPPPPANTVATASTAAATVNSTAPCTRSPSHGSPTTPKRGATQPGAPPRARHHARSNAASNATSPAGSTTSSTQRRPRSPTDPDAATGPSPARSDRALDTYKHPALRLSGFRTLIHARK